MTKFTVWADGSLFGTRLAEALRALGHDAWDAPADCNPASLTGTHLLYAVQPRAHAIAHPGETPAAGLVRLETLLQEAPCETFTYCSSTSVYDPAQATVDERSALVNPTGLSEQLAWYSEGERLALTVKKQAKVVRLSQIYGPVDAADAFLANLVRSAIVKHGVMLDDASTSAGDYVCWSDVVRTLPEIAARGRERVYNLAAGEPVTHAQLAARISSLTGCTVRYAVGCPRVVSPRVSNLRLQREFGFRPRNVLDDLPSLVDWQRAVCEVAA